MKSYLETEKEDLKRRRRELIIIVCLAVVIVLLTYLGIKVFDLGLDLPISSSILIFALININVILLLLLIFLTLRNLVKLFFERKKNIMGAKLRTKLVLAFVTLSLLPTIILFFASVQAISSSIEYWYNLPIERSLTNSVEVGQGYQQNIYNEIISFGNNLSGLITYNGYMLPSKKDELERFINEKRTEYRFASIKVFSQKLESMAVAMDDNTDLSSFQDPGKEALQESFDKGTDVKYRQSSVHGDLVSVIVPIFSGTESKEIVGLIALGKFIPEVYVNRLNGMSSGLEQYNEFKTLKRPMKTSYMIMLSIVTLLIIFTSVWFGFYLSKGITVPIQELAEGTERIASGDYDFFIDLEATDEIGVLVNSFNRMTLDLKDSKKQLEETNEELIRSNIEIERRRLYMEIVLANVAAGVISADNEGRILTINKSAQEMLGINAKNVIGINYKDVMDQGQVKIIKDLLEDRSLLRRGFVQKQVILSTAKKNLTLLVSINMLRDDQGKYSGLVAVFDDFSEIERAQRMAAWRDVARRIAHEVKNPLTPIQLSAQRLQKRYGYMLSKEDGKIFEECTDMIIDQVEGLKRLVNEFSSFARMPALNPRPENINQIIKEAVDLYKETQKDVKVIFHDIPEIPVFKMDREQIKRAMINLLDNAIAAIEGTGEVIVNVSYDRGNEMVRIEVADNGIGIPSYDKSRVFEPYFSTKKHGTGLGLAIVNTIIHDHNGFIDIQDNQPRGTRFIIDLPVNL
jgi:two-component system, NtrC family, nitrogen regulation sensor histidine kinase NtrY